MDFIPKIGTLSLPVKKAKKCKQKFTSTINQMITTIQIAQKSTQYSDVINKKQGFLKCTPLNEILKEHTGKKNKYSYKLALNKSTMQKRKRKKRKNPKKGNHFAYKGAKKGCLW